MARQSFYDILTAAVADISTNGYETPEQIEHWLLALREAAGQECGTPEHADAELAAALGSAYGRLVEHGGLNRYVSGVPRYGLEMVKPRLRAELDRRIMASADLIRLHRRDAIDTTLQRFSGWATSIPAGGVSDETRTEVKKRVGKDLTQYKFECRRVAIDQGHKLAANISEIVATDNGAIAGAWVSHWRRAGYNYRRDHRDLDGDIFLVRDSWAVQEGLVKPAGRKYTDEVPKPAQLPFCSCNYRWIMSPRRLPEDMLTAKGHEWIAKGKAA